MTHEFEGHYRGKHPVDARPDPQLARELRAKAADGRVSCAAAFAIVRECGSNPEAVGRAADLLELKITKCQLGLFGYKKEKRNIVEPAESVAEDLKRALRGATSEGRLSCKEAWDLARRFGLSKMEITAACEKLSIPIASCQLGTF